MQYFQKKQGNFYSKHGQPQLNLNEMHAFRLHALNTILISYVHCVPNNLSNYKVNQLPNYISSKKVHNKYHPTQF